MTLEETIDLLTVAAAYDKRTVGKTDAVAWHAAVGDLDFADSKAAVVGHYTEGTDWLMPAHVRQRVKVIRDKRWRETEIPPPPPELLDDPDAWRAALRAANTAAADGRDPAAAMQAIARHARKELPEAHRD